MDSDEDIKVKKGKKEKVEAKSKKEKKKRKRDEADAQEADTRTKDKRKEEKKKLKEQKKAEKEDILKKVPKLDEDGIAYTKLQMKRMVKRVKRGLDPIETEEEERERLRERKREEMETQAEFADEIEKEASDNDQDKSGESEEEEDSPKENDGEDDENVEEEVTCPIVPVKARPSKKPRSKPVPADYTCFACKNKHKPAHWIYDCPDKLYQPGYREVKKSKRGMTEPSSRKVFVTGLPFNARSKDVKIYFEKDKNCGKVAYCKLLTFEDTKRCKGNGIITFESDEGARNALKLDRTEFQLGVSDNKIESKDKKEKKSLWLGVKKVRNRAR